MLRLQGNPKTLCDGLTRRDLLHVGGLASLGVSLADVMRLQAAPATTAPRPHGFGQAKACILLFPYGSPPQHETFDPKPNAPAEVQGEMKSIATAIPGTRICEGLPRIAKVLDRVTVVRSMTHPYPLHGVAYAVSGIPTYTPALENRPRDPMHWPFIGSVVDYLDARRTGGVIPNVPRNIALPWMLNSKTDLLINAGPFAAFLGQSYDPIWVDYDGKGTRIVPHYSDENKKFYDPYGGTTPDGRFFLSSLDKDQADVPPARLNNRRTLLGQFDRARAAVDAQHPEATFDRYQQNAFSLLTSGRMRVALDIAREPLALREAYGMNLFGQACLAARRLVEAGARFVTIFWDGFGQFGGCAWDTHSNHYPRLKEYLLPGFDQAYPTLLHDLETRGLLDETLVLWLSEHGRTPRIDSKPKGAGRHHWSKAYSIALAGGGTPRGKVVGSTDKHGGEVSETPVSPKDILATSYHLLGIDAGATVPDMQGRPHHIAGTGQLRPELLA